MDDNAKRREALADIRKATKRMIKQSMEEDGVASETTPEELSHIVVSSWEMLEPTRLINSLIRWKLGKPSNSW